MTDKQLIRACRQFRKGLIFGDISRSAAVVSLGGPAMSAAESAVRAAWKETILDGLYLYESTRIYHLQLGDWEYKGTVKNKDAVWEAAHAFTLERQEEKRQIEKDMLWIADVRTGSDDDRQSKKRTLARLQAALAEASRGMKGFERVSLESAVNALIAARAAEPVAQGGSDGN